MKFVWDPKKAKANVRKHGVTFEEASSVFFDELAKIAQDPDHSISEERQILIGHSFQRRLLFVVHIEMAPEEAIRIISARKATKREKRDYEEV
jgi:uncharacterized DUF497 family protein